MLKLLPVPKKLLKMILHHFDTAVNNTLLYFYEGWYPQNCGLKKIFV